MHRISWKFYEVADKSRNDIDISICFPDCSANFKNFQEQGSVKLLLQEKQFLKGSIEFGKDLNLNIKKKGNGI